MLYYPRPEDVYPAFLGNVIYMVYPEVEDYHDYRDYLNDLFNWHKEKLHFFSHRYIVTKAGYKSPTVLKDVIDRKKNLTIKSAEKFIRAFNLTKDEIEYFMQLYQFNMADTIKEKDRIFHQLTSLKKKMAHRVISKDEYSILHDWWTLVIREAISLPDYKHSRKWLSRVLHPEVSIEDVDKSLDILLDTDMIKMEDGVWKVNDPVIKTPRRANSLIVAKFHKQMIELAQRALWEIPSAQREISGTTLRVNGKQLEEIKNKIYELRQIVLQMAEKSEDADMIYQLNFQLFPLIKNKRK